MNNFMQIKLFLMYLVIGRKREFFVQFKEDEKFNRRNTFSILRIKL